MLTKVFVDAARNKSRVEQDLSFHFVYVAESDH